MLAEAEKMLEKKKWGREELNKSFPRDMERFCIHRCEGPARALAVLTGIALLLRRN